MKKEVVACIILNSLLIVNVNFVFVILYRIIRYFPGIYPTFILEVWGNPPSCVEIVVSSMDWIVTNSCRFCFRILSACVWDESVVVCSTSMEIGISINGSVNVLGIACVCLLVCCFPVSACWNTSSQFKDNQL